MKRLENHRLLVLYDIVVYLLSVLVLLVLYEGYDKLSPLGVIEQGLLALVLILITRYIGKIYKQVWRYGGVKCYLQLVLCDAIAFLLYVPLEMSLPLVNHISFSRKLSLICVNLLGSLIIRFIYRYAYMNSDNNTKLGRFLSFLLKQTSGISIDNSASSKVKIGIVGAGRVGVALAEELLNANSSYEPRVFIDNSKEKAGREILGISIIDEDDNLASRLNELGIQEVVLAIPDMSDDKRKATFELYKNLGYKLKTYDYPTMYSPNSKRQLRDLDIEELLFRKSIDIKDEKAYKYYKNKTILITGGGGSIGSELVRQLARMSPKQIVILDIYENGAYTIEQELKIAYKDKVKVAIEICSITNLEALEKVFKSYKIDIVIHAAAHKHVPLMEHNVLEAILNNVFGTKNVLDLCEKYKVDRFMMVSTDKAVNPTNVMGATKRMCELLVNNYSTHNIVKCSSTRFGNVLGSAGSVIPLFKSQIQSGGPITITDKRIIRYFMTIPEASSLVLESGALANNGELFVLDMGEPIKILDLATNMIKLSGASNIDIVETGLRPGEKLYEELLVDTNKLDKTSNSLIFIEKDKPLTDKQLSAKLNTLSKAIKSNDDLKAKEALHKVVPTYKEVKK